MSMILEYLAEIIWFLIGRLLMFLIKQVGNVRLHFARKGMSITEMKAGIEDTEIPSLRITCKLDSKTEVRLSLASAILAIRTKQSYIGVVQGEIGHTPLLHATARNVKGRGSSNLTFICPLSPDIWCNISSSINIYNSSILAHTMWGDIYIDIPDEPMEIDSKALENLKAKFKTMGR